MNGSSGPNGSADSVHTPQTDNVAQLVQALDAIHNPRSSNETRRDATIFLETAKSRHDAPTSGFALAADSSRSPIIRHFGCSLLEHFIKYKCERHTAFTSELREWIVRLAQDIKDDEPVFFRNKVAQLWSEFAKRFWVEEWHDMDNRLVALWHQSFAHQMLVLHVLESLCEDVFTREDHTKHADDGAACIEIFTSSFVLSEAFPRRDNRADIRSGDEGWFQRLLEKLQWCLSNYSTDRPQVRACLLQSLQTVLSTIPWILLPAVRHSNCIETIGNCLQMADLQIRMAALEVFYALYHRPQYADDHVEHLVCPMLSSQGLSLLRSVFESSGVDVEDIDEQKYLVLKKTSEVMSALGGFLEARSKVVGPQCDINNILDFLQQILQHPSMVVSIPVLYMWTKLLACKSAAVADAVSPHIAVLLQTCCPRLIRYESLPSESRDETFLFLQEDFDTTPERHAFIGNYRRFCAEIVEKVVRKSPFDALRHILAQAKEVTDASGSSTVNRDTYDSNSFAVLGVDAQCTVVLSAVKGYLSWLASRRSKGEDHDAEHEQMLAAIEHWCTDLLRQDFADPVIQRRTLQLVCEIATHAFGPQSSVPLLFCQRALLKAKVVRETATAFDDALRELCSSLARMLQRLAMSFCDAFMRVYDDLQSEIERAVSQDGLDQRTGTELKAVLFIIVHRTTLIGNDEKSNRLRVMLEPIVNAWRDPKISTASGSFDSFCELLGIEEVPQYFLSCRAQSIEDWSSHALSEHGLRIKSSINTRTESLPFMATRSLLAVSTDRVRRDSTEFTLAETLWSAAIPAILPNLLQLVSHAHAFGNPSKWSKFPDEMQIIIQRSLQDRVWQSGISTESRDDFYNRVRKSKDTLEGLASATRGAVRSIRELSYWILHCMSQYGHAFYKHQDLAEPLARALYEDAHTLSSHQCSTLLKISMALIDGCPLELRPTFLPPLLSNLFTQLDRKITGEWELIERRAEAGANEDDLDQEMKAESVLRQLTYSAVMLASSLVGQSPGQVADGSNGTLATGGLWEMILVSLPTLSALVIFCNHTLRMRDTRSCSQVTRVLRSLIPDFVAQVDPQTGDLIPKHPVVGATTGTQIREFFCSDVLKCAITSLHEPYFAEMHKELGLLIASILAQYAPLTSTPRDVLLSLPGLEEQRVDRALESLGQVKSERRQRDIVLGLLEGLTGVSIYESGKIARRQTERRKNVVPEQFLAMDEGPTIKRGGSAELGGVNELFG